MKNPAASSGVSEERDENYRKGVTPLRCDLAVYSGQMDFLPIPRVATFRWRPSTSSGLLRSVVSLSNHIEGLDSRLKHAGMTVFGEEIILSQQAAGN